MGIKINSTVIPSDAVEDGIPDVELSYSSVTDGIYIAQGNTMVSLTPSQLKAVVKQLAQNGIVDVWGIAKESECDDEPTPSAVLEQYEEYQDIVKLLETTLVPRGTKPVVELRLQRNSFFKHQYIRECLEELSRISIAKHHFGDTFTPLERLATNVLIDTANLPKEVIARLIAKTAKAEIRKTLDDKGA